MPRPRFDRLDPKKRTRILEAAGMAFATHGFDGASMNHILEQAGISKGAAYYYFDDKADLFATVVRHYFQNLFEGGEALMASMTREGFWDQLAAVYRATMAQLGEKTWTLGLVRAVYRLPLEAKTLSGIKPLFDTAQRWLEQLVRRGRELGTIRRDLPEDLLLTWMTGLDVVMDRWIAENLTTIDQNIIEALTALSMDLLHRLFDPPAPGEEIDLGELVKRKEQDP